MRYTAAVLLLALLLPRAHAQTVRTGTGFAISVRTLIVTNAHVVKGCRSLRVLQDGAAEPARLVALDDRADLAVLRTDLQTPKIAALRVQPPVRLGEDVVTFGFPLSGSLSKEGNLTTGNVSALAGLKDDPTYFQITAPVQPGNSGGPLMDDAGNVIAVVTSKLDALKLAQRIGDIPQNVNFAIKAQVLKGFLDGQRLTYSEQVATEKLAVADIADLARAFTVQVECSPASYSSQVEQPEQRGGGVPAPQPVPVPMPLPPPPAGPPAAAGLPDWVRAITVVDAKTPFPATAPSTRQLTLANASDRRVYEVTLAWVDTDTPEPCNVARERFAGQRALYANLPPGGRATIFADFPPAARAFCVVDAKASAVTPRRAPVPAQEAPPQPEGDALDAPGKQ
jgi:S1-C subfamily serine protease